MAPKVWPSGMELGETGRSACEAEPGPAEQYAVAVCASSQTREREAEASGRLRPVLPASQGESDMTRPQPEGPPFISTAMVAQAMGWRVERARRTLLRTGAGKLIAGRVLATPGDLLVKLPEVFHALDGSDPWRMLDTSALASLMDKPVWYARRFMIKHGAVRKLRGRYVTCAAKLAAHFPEKVREIMADSLSSDADGED